MFEAFDVDSTAGYFSVILVAFIIGFTTETLSVVQSSYDQRTTAKVRKSKTKQRQMRCCQGIVLVMRVFCSYLCMLSVMTYNVGVMFAVVGGLGVSYFLMGFQPAEIIIASRSLQTSDAESIGLLGKSGKSESKSSCH